MSLPEFHARLGNTAVYFFLILGAWGLWRFFRKQGLDSSYWGAVVIGELLVIAQGVLGAYMWVTGLRPGRGGMHILYGVVAAIIIPGIYAYTKGEENRRVMIIYGVALLIGAIIILRAATTGPG